MVKERRVPEPPEWWPGSRPEYYVYWALLSLGKRIDVDFTYQSPQMGGRLAKGGAVIDFLFINPPNLGINVSSRYYHYRTTPQRMRGQMQRAQLEGYGIRLIFIDEEDALSDPRWYVREALEFRDHSFEAGR